jgi:hypothetical protein
MMVLSDFGYTIQSCAEAVAGRWRIERVIRLRAEGVRNFVF